MTFEKLTARAQALLIARREVNSKAIDKYLLTNGLSDYDSEPKYRSVTKRLYRPYDTLFSPKKNVQSDLKPSPRNLFTIKISLTHLKDLV